MRRYSILDVFTQKAFTGNPLAVVRDCDGLDAAQMQGIAAEFNLSETVFVLPPLARSATARLRIFTPKAEVPFAGHPTIGAAILLAGLEAPPGSQRETTTIILEEEACTLTCRVRRAPGEVADASFALPRLPVETGLAPPAEHIAAALGLAPKDIGFGPHRPSIFSAGMPFAFVPVAGLATIARAQPDPSCFDKVFSGLDAAAAYLYTSDTVDPAHAFHARMFSPGLGIVEDPATGSAVAALAGVLMTFEAPGDGHQTQVIEQGYEIGRPSLITLCLDIEAGALKRASIGGHAVLTAEGSLFP